MTFLMRWAPLAGILIVAGIALGAFAASWGLKPAIANDCQAQCQAQENACRRATKDSPSCSAEMTRCLQSCRQQR